VVYPFRQEYIHALTRIHAHVHVHMRAPTHIHTLAHAHARTHTHCRWRRDPHQTLSLARGGWKELQSDFVSVFRQRIFATFYDYDDHLDDISKDPLNPHLNSMGKLALPGQNM